MVKYDFDFFTLIFGISLRKGTSRGGVSFQIAIGARRAPNFIFTLYSGFMDSKTNITVVPIE